MSNWQDEPIDLAAAAAIYKRSQRWRFCGHCSQEFKTKRWASPQRFCKKACVRPSRPNKNKGKTGLWTRTDVGRWAHHKRANILKPPGPCERCGGPGQVVHHKDENPANNTLDNLERLCRACHINHHRDTVTRWTKGLTP